MFLLIASLRFVWKVMLFWAGVFRNIPNRRARENVFIILLLAIDFYCLVKINNKFPRWLFNWMDGDLALPLVILRMSGLLTSL